jgi:hypothetical protein
MVAKIFMKYLIIYWIWVDCTISISYEKLYSCDFTKKLDKVFHSNKHNYVGKKNCWKITFIWKITRIIPKAFVSKSTLHVYQNTGWNQRKIDLQIIQNVLKKKTFSRIKWPPCSVFSPLVTKKMDNETMSLGFTQCLSSIIFKTSSCKLLCI